MKCRKMTTLLVIILTAFTILSATTALSVNTIQSVSSLTLYSLECPAEARAYAESTFSRFLDSAAEDGSVTVGDQASLGTPFTILAEWPEVYYFPIVSYDAVIATYRVFKDIATDVYTGILSVYLAKELNALSDTADSLAASKSENTVFLYNDNGNIMAQINGNAFMLTPDPRGNLPELTSFDIQGYDVQKVKPLNLTATIDTTLLIQRVPNSYYIVTTSIVETQGSNSWCGAYVTAYCIRAAKSYASTPKATTLMSIAYPNGYTTYDPFDTSDSVYAAKYHYSLYPTHATSSLSVSTVHNQICVDKPVYMYIYNPDGVHAAAIRGYNAVNDTYSIWNPWNNYFETISNSSTTFNSCGYTYSWTESIYNW